MGRPNIVLCVMDDHRHDALGLCGTPGLRTPFLDHLADRGMRFANARIPGSTLAAVCAPSRAMLHSGHSLFRLHEDGAFIADSHSLLGECLREVGYDTFHTGKWHNGKASLHRGFTHADEVFFGGMNDPWNTPLNHHDPDGRYDARLPMIRDPWTTNELQYRTADHVYPGHHCTDVFCDRAAEYIRGHGRTRPFFLSLALMAPHDPRTAPPQYHAEAAETHIPTPPNFRAFPAHDTGALDIRDEMLASRPRRPEEIRRHRADYYAMVRHLDDGLSRVMAALRESGIDDNTIFVFTSDHGLALGEHGLMGKQNLYEHSIRVPLIVAGPGIPASTVRTDPVLNLDLFRSFCRAAAVDVPDDVEGRDLEWDRPSRDDTGGGPERGYFAYRTSIRAIRMDEYKLIEYGGTVPRATELFHLTDDPWETRNLAHTPDDSARLHEMRARMLEAARSSGDLDHAMGQAFWENMDLETQAAAR
ncbi:MAG: sulfatase-like hydrolase/transferase [Phycisphaeraceae bacterium]|nr:sulfatase-like hydrolase/transferase [Phycisphaeraceae bacterium]